MKKKLDQKLCLIGKRDRVRAWGGSKGRKRDKSLKVKKIKKKLKKNKK